jgi:hypothetical protein
MGLGTESFADQIKHHRMISLRQYAIAALAAAGSAGLWWSITRRNSVLVTTLAFGLLLPLTAHRALERTWIRIAWALFAGALVAAGDWYLQRNGAVR